jgi:cytochrome c556
MPLVERFVGRHDHVRALRLADAIVVESPFDLAQKHLTYARVLRGQGSPEAAFARAQEARAAAPAEPSVLLDFARFAAAAARFEEAVEAAEQAAGLPGAPRDAQATLAAMRAARASSSRR